MNLTDEQTRVNRSKQQLHHVITLAEQAVVHAKEITEDESDPMKVGVTPIQRVMAELAITQIVLLTFIAKEAIVTNTPVVINDQGEVGQN